MKLGPQQVKTRQTDLEFFKIVFKIYGNVFYGRKARAYKVEVLNSCYDDMICIERDFYHLEIINIY